MIDDIVRRNGYLSLGSRLRRIGERLQRETQMLMQTHGVPIQANQYPLIGAIDEYGPLSIGDLAVALGVRQPGVTRNVGLLIEQGMVSVRRGTKDQRTKVVDLTDLGRELAQQGRAVVWPQIEHCVANIISGKSGSLLDHLDHLEDALHHASFTHHISQSKGNRDNG